MRRYLRLSRWLAILLVCSMLAPWWMALRPATAQPNVVVGWFHILWYDGPPGSGLQGEQYWLDTDQGDSYRLLIDPKLFVPFGGVLALNRQRVKITTDALPAAAPGPLRVQSIALEQIGQPEPQLTGAQPWVNLLCKFSDIPAEPQPLSYFEGLMGNAYPQLDHYWRQVSYNTINLTGSASRNWKTLPHPRSHYMTGTSINLTALFNDCTAIHDADVYFPNFVGINLMFNETLEGPCNCAWGGSRTATLDGVTKNYRVTWEPPWGYNNQGVLAHEMGHGWGWPHSSGPYGATYDSRWDVMSDLWGNCPPYHPTYGCVGQGTISYHLGVLAPWIPSSRIFVPALNTVTTIEIERLHQPLSGTSYLMARIPIPNSSQFYTVEARRLTGYDGNLPGEAIIIHHVDAARSSDAWVVDADGDLDGDCDGADSNCDPDDAGARWLPGETFLDAANNIRVQVNALTATGFSVTITYGNPLSCGNTGALFRVERATGNVCADGSFNAGGADVAEYVRVSEPVSPGDVLELDPSRPGHYRKARGPYSTFVAGVVSSVPGVILGARGQPEGRALLALLGRVPVKATTEGGPIRPGDLLTSASKMGYAMRCESLNRCEGAIVGKALQALDQGEDVILVLLMR
ncbi:MAG: hypothetical protein RMJ96_04200 [Candidatus Bipolaricaulota bacterium]|nr:hypothetical protein [Candidatus Bipolaricaulota bacterium]